MRNTLAFLAAAVVVVGAVGFYLGWFSVRAKPAEDGHKKYVFDVNTEKIEEDALKAEQKIAEKVEKAGKEVEGEAPKTSEVKASSGRKSHPPGRP